MDEDDDDESPTAAMLRNLMRLEEQYQRRDIGGTAASSAPPSNARNETWPRNPVGPRRPFNHARSTPGAELRRDQRSSSTRSSRSSPAVPSSGAAPSALRRGADSSGGVMHPSPGSRLTAPPLPPATLSTAEQSGNEALAAMRDLMDSTLSRMLQTQAGESGSVAAAPLQPQTNGARANTVAPTVPLSEGLLHRPLLDPPLVSQRASGKEMGDAGSAEDKSCVICWEKPRNATIVHGETGHGCCCIDCAKELKARNQPCPICRESIDLVIRQFS